MHKLNNKSQDAETILIREYQPTTVKDYDFINHASSIMGSA